VAVPVAEALQKSHASFVWHLDVNPTNILVRRVGGAWVIELKTTGKNLIENRTYSAPEQAGQGGPGPHSDVYSFGKTCYYALLEDPDPDDTEKSGLSEPWRVFLGQCTAKKISNRLRDFTTVLARLVELASIKSALQNDGSDLSDSGDGAKPSRKQVRPKEKSGKDPSEAEVLYLKSKEIQARGYDDENGFVVMADSHATKDALASLGNLVELRDWLIQQGILVAINGGFIFKDGYSFKSPSAAASVVMGCSRNGLIAWKNADGITLKEIQNEADGEAGEAQESDEDETASVTGEEWVKPGSPTQADDPKDVQMLYLKTRKIDSRGYAKKKKFVVVAGSLAVKDACLLSMKNVGKSATGSFSKGCWSRKKDRLFSKPIIALSPHPKQRVLLWAVPGMASSPGETRMESPSKIFKTGILPSNPIYKEIPWYPAQLPTMRDLNPLSQPCNSSFTKSPPTSRTAHPVPSAPRCAKAGCTWRAVRCGRWSRS
jgi:serine/threonine protein kinase